MNAVLEEKLKNLPTDPGVYKYFDANGEIIYIGKAKNLKNRVKSYFLNSLRKGTKTHKLVLSIADLEITKVASEFEALILEAELIRKYQPKYNIQLKDDKSYLYIVFRKEKFKIGDKQKVIPSFLLARATDLKKTDKYFGPFTDASTAKYIYKSLRRTFPLRDCSLAKFKRYQKLKTPCLYGHIGVCPAPCVSAEGMDIHKENEVAVRRVLTGKSGVFEKSLQKKMIEASESQKFEIAAKYRDILKKYDYLRSKNKIAQKYIDNPYLIDDLQSQSIDELLTNIPILNELPNRIECYDISNISGKSATAGMTVAIDGKVDNREYRHFKIKLKDTPDDFEMMRETLRRRLKTKWTLPDLIVVDGGKGQVSAANDVLEELGIEIALIGLAKRYETIVYKDEDGFVELNLSHENLGLKLLMNLRDEAHRFSRRLHHKIRIKDLLQE